MLGVAGSIAAITLAPFLLPAVGIGKAQSTADMMHFMGGHGQEGFFGFGLAGGLQEAFSQLPLIGDALTSTVLVTMPGLGFTLGAGALMSLAAIATIGIGGMLWANWLEKRENPQDTIRWSRIIRTASLITSGLIALPALLGGISVGITFLAHLLTPGQAGNVAITLRDTLGGPSMNAGSAAVNGIAALLPHLITCALPVFAFLGGVALEKPGKASQQPTLELVSATPTQPGQPCAVAFRLTDAKGKPLRDSDLATTHTEKLHTMVIDRTLSDYHHLHPRYNPSSGLFEASFTPRLAQPYMAWHDFTLSGADSPTHQRMDLPAARPAPRLPARIAHQSQSTVDDLSAMFQPEPPLQANQASTLTVQLNDAHGLPLRNLEPIMGAYAHLVGFSADGRHFIHAHPLNETPPTNGRLQFHLTPEQAGPTRFFLQIQQQGMVKAIPFGQQIRQPALFSSRATAPVHAGHGHALAA